MQRLSAGVSTMLDRAGHKMMAGSVWAIIVALLAAFGLFWSGLALHWLLMPRVGMWLSWLIPAGLYFLVAGVIGYAVFGRTPDRERHDAGQTQGPAAPWPLIAEQLGMELGQGMEQQVQRHPLRSVSLAALGGVLLGASPELRRSLRDLLGSLNQDNRRR